MKRPIKPFVVEVRKGQKKPNTPENWARTDDRTPEDDSLRRAEAALFGPSTSPEQSGAPGRSGRILETISDAEPVAVLPVEETPAGRRGRPPGSKNKPKPVDEKNAFPKRRGRPPRIAEGQVRQVPVTPELTNAALESIARAKAPVPVSPLPQGRSAVVPVKRPRGRPRKTELDGTPILRPAAPAPVHAAPVSAAVNLPRAIRHAVEGAGADQGSIAGRLRRPRAGEGWKRRLRGMALNAFERRHRKEG